MTKRGALIILAFCAVCLTVRSQQLSDSIDGLSVSTICPSGIWNAIDSSAMMRQLPILPLLDGEHLLISTPLGRMGMTPVVNLPIALVSAVPAQRANPGRANEVDAKDYKESAPSEIALQKSPWMFQGGEIGVFYGRSIGKHGGDDYGSYFESSVGNEKFQINVGGSYQESSGHLQRWGR